MHENKNTNWLGCNVPGTHSRTADNRIRVKRLPALSPVGVEHVIRDHTALPITLQQSTSPPLAQSLVHHAQRDMSSNAHLTTALLDTCVVSMLVQQNSCTLPAVVQRPSVFTQTYRFVFWVT